MNTRIKAERQLLRLHYPVVDLKEADGLHWFLVDGFRTPVSWCPDLISVAFHVTQAFPGTQPYGFFVPADLSLAGAPPAETQASQQPPFPGIWRFLSWTTENWRPSADVARGSNLWGWVRSFRGRLREGP